MPSAIARSESARSTAASMGNTALALLRQAEVMSRMQPSPAVRDDLPELLRYASTAIVQLIRGTRQ